MLPLLTHIPPPKSPPVDAPYPSPPRTREDTSAAALLARKGNLKRIFLTATAAALFGVYQDLVQQNPGVHLDGGFDEDGN